MFIPRTLADRGSRAVHPGAMGRALAIAGIVALALFLILSANITVGQENLEVGQLAPRDIRAPIRGDLRLGEPDRCGPRRRRGRGDADHRDDQVAGRQPRGPAPQLRHHGATGGAHPRASRRGAADRRRGRRAPRHRCRPARNRPASRSRRDGRRALGRRRRRRSRRGRHDPGRPDQRGRAERHPRRGA